MLIGVASPLLTQFEEKASCANCWSMQADGDMYANGEGKGNVFSFTTGEKIGMLLDMEEKKLTYFKNGAKQSVEPFTICEEVHLLACFGGSDQLVTINHDPEIPEAVQEILD
jgi:hypothetical protein